MRKAPFKGTPMRHAGLTFEEMRQRDTQECTAFEEQGDAMQRLLNVAIVKKYLAEKIPAFKGTTSHGECLAVGNVYFS